MTDSLYNNLIANAVLAGFYVGYKVLQRFMHSKCRYGADGLEFDMDPEEQADAGIEMERVANFLKSRALVHKGTTRNL